MEALMERQKKEMEVLRLQEEDKRKKAEEKER